MSASSPAKLALYLVSCNLISAQPNYDPAVVLARARDKVLELTDRLPKYICMQTANRRYYRATEKIPRGTTCDNFAGQKNLGRRHLELAATDRLRLDVIVTDGHEVYSWAGAGHFDLRWAGDLVGQGPVGTGPFGTFLLDIFRNDGVHFEFQNTAQLRGHTVLEFAYQVPKEASHYFTRSMDRNWLTTAFSGSLWVNPITGELERLTVLTSELPAETGACTAATRIDYQSVQLGTGGFLLPLESELHFLLRDGTESIDATTYSNCHEYIAESTLSFAEPGATIEKPVAP